MNEFIKRLARFIVFRNVFIALCAVAMTLETRWFFDLPVRVDALLCFVFFATFFEYNLHAVGGRLNPASPFKSLTQLHQSGVPVTTRACILVGFVGAAVSLALLEIKEIFFVAAMAGLTLAYTLPVVRFRGKFLRVREVTYLKVFTVALGWSLVTVVLPLLTSLEKGQEWEALIIFLRRFLFIYAITIPFEIRDLERERRFGNVSLPMIYGVDSMKRAGLYILAAFVLLCAVQEKYLALGLAGRHTIFIPLALSAVAAAFLVIGASDKKSNWYFKFWTDGTMIIQFVLLLLFN